jgi:hypothetical protein
MIFMGAKMERRKDKRLIISEAKEMTLEMFHRLLGHASLDTTKDREKRLKLNLIGSFKHYGGLHFGKN